MIQKLQIHFDKDHIQQTLLNTAFVLFLLSLLYQFIEQIFTVYGYDSWYISEFLINYQGGFVRRGLSGEIIFFFAKKININVEWTVKIISLICFLSVCIFFIRSFLKKGYSLYILPLGFFFGSLIFNDCYWTRKDPLMLLSLIGILWIYNKTNKIAIKFLTINILLICTLFIHEVFVFFVIPVLFLLLFNKYKNRGFFQSFFLSLSFLLPSILGVFLILIYSGNQEIAENIWNSWVAVLNIETTTVSPAAIDAVGWESIGTFIYHFYSNFLIKDMLVVPVFVWAVTFPLIYYIATNALLVFKKNDKIYTNKDKTNLSSVLIFQFLCLSPVFLALSCDYGRVIFYWIASSFAIFLLTPNDKIENIFPPFFIGFIERINNGLANILRPTKTTVSLLMMFIGVSSVHFYFEKIICNSMAYNILYLLSKITALKSIMLNIFI